MYTCPLLELCKCGTNLICGFCIQVTIIAIAMVFGALLMWKPKKVIEIQIALYRPFNWKIEPISMEKEIRNTRIMGMVVFILGVISLVYIIIQQL